MASFTPGPNSTAVAIDTFRISVPHGWLEEAGFKLSDRLYFWYSEATAKFETGNPNGIFNYVNGQPFHYITKTIETGLKPAFKWKKGENNLSIVIQMGEKDDEND